METHYEKVITGTPKASLAPYDGDLAKACLAMAQKGRSECCVKLMAEFARPDASGSFLAYAESERGQAMAQYIDNMITLTGRSIGSRSGEITTQLLMAWQFARYENGGLRTYVVEPGLQRRLLATELRNIRCQDLRLPYPCIYVCMDEALGFRVYNEGTGWHSLVGIYLTEDDGGLRVMTCGKGDGLDDALSHFHLPLAKDPEAPLDDVLDALANRVRTQDKAWAESQGMGSAAIDDLLDSWFSAFKWVMNLVFYVTHSEPGENIEMNKEARRLWQRASKLPRGPKRKSLVARANALPSRQRIVVGRGVKVDKSLPRSTGEVRALLTRTLVAGHWQRYAVGPKRAKREWRFKEPFWRGQGSEEGSNVHEVR